MEMNNEPERSGQESVTPSPETISAPPPAPEPPPQPAPDPGPQPVQGYDSLYSSVQTKTAKPPKKPFLERFRGWIRELPVPAGFWFIVLFLVADAIFSIPAMLAPEGAARSIIYDAVGLVWPFLLLWLSGYMDSLRLDAKKFGKTLLIALPLLIIGGLGVLWEIFNTPSGASIQWQSAPFICAGVLKLLRIAFAEIAVFFGITAHSIGEKEGRDQEGVWYSAIISGVIFGLFTFVNTFAVDGLKQGIALGISAAVLGTVYAAVYYRGGSLYPVMLLHLLYAAAQNFSSCFAQGTDAAVSILNEYSSGNYFMSAVGFFLLFFLLRHKKIREAIENLRGAEEAARFPGDMTRAERRKAKRECAERRREALKQQYEDAPLAFRIFRVYLFKPIGVLCGVACGVGLVVLGAFSLLMDAEFMDTQKELWNASGREDVDRSVIEEMSPIDAEGAAAINVLPRGKDSDTWTICLYMVGANLEDMGEDDLATVVRVQTYEQRKKLQEESLQNDIKRVADYSDELAKKGIELPSYLYTAQHPDASAGASSDSGTTIATGRGAASADIDEILSESWNDQITVVIQTGGATRWSNQLVNPNRTQRFLYKNGQFEEIANLPVQDSCSVESLSGFLRFCDENYRSDHNMLVLWDHGGGAFGYGGDSIFGTNMSLRDLRKALKSVYKPDRSKPAFDIIGFDACLMSSLEVVHYLDGFASYLTVSEETEPGFGWEYTSWLQTLSDDPAMSPAQVAMSVADTYMDYYMKQNASKTLFTMLVGSTDVTFSVIDENKGCELYDAYCALTKAQLTDAAKDISVLSEIGRCGKRSTQFCGSASTVFNTVDLGNYVDYMIDTYPKESSRIKDLLEQTVLYHRESGALSDSQGLSVYLPCSISDYYGTKYFLDYIYNVCDDESTKALYYYKMAGCLNDDMLYYLRTLSKEAPQVIDTSIFKAFSKTEPIIGDDGFRVSIDPKIQQMTVGYYAECAIYDPDHYLIIDLGYDENAVLDGEGSLECDFDGTWICLDGVPLATDVVSSTASSVEYRAKVNYNGSASYLLFSYDRDSDEFTVNGIAKIPNSAENVNFLTNTKSVEEVETGSKIVPLYQVTDMISQKILEKEGKSVTFRSGSSIECKTLGNGYYLTTAVITDQRGDRYYSKVVGNTVSGGSVSERKVDATFYGSD